jgi:pyrroline-5-carboxylate reductase
MKLGIIGGTGWLGGSIARRLLGTGHVAQVDLWLSNRSGKRDGFEAWPDVTITDNSAALIAACDAVVLAVRPEQLADLGVDAADRLVISVMASTPMARLGELTGASRIIRTMPSPATEHGEGFTPWFASDDVTDDDRVTVQGLFDACGIAEEVASEAQIDWFTGLTGPAPGLFGYAAHALIEASVAHGIDRKVAERAIRFHAMAAGNEIWRSDHTPAQDFQRIIDYGGVTTAGFQAASGAGAMEAFTAALDAALEVAKKDRT